MLDVKYRNVKDRLIILIIIVVINCMNVKKEYKKARYINNKHLII